MNLANTFYIVGIVAMTLYTILLVAIVILLMYIWKKFLEIQRKVEDRLEDLRDFMKHPKETATDMGAAAASGVLSRVANLLRNKKTTHE